MNNINLTIFSLLLFLSIIFFLLSFFLVYKNHRYLKATKNQIDDSENAIKVFLSTVETLIKFSIRKISRLWKLYFHYLILLTLKMIDLVNSVMSKFYAKLRNYFISKSTENKTLVVHFWSHLKYYKKEKDKEEEEE